MDELEGRTPLERAVLMAAQLVYSEAARAGEPIGEPHMRAVLAKMGHSHPDVRSWLLDRRG